jgi:hypothetical protein
MPKSKEDSNNRESDKSKISEKSEKDETKTFDELIKDLEAIRGTRVLTLLFSDDESINDSTVRKVYDRLKSNYSDTKKLDVIIYSGGGDIDAAYGVAEIIRRFAPEKLTFIVPRWAKSAATLLVCSGEEIMMNITSELGPLDPQIFLPDPLTHSLEVFSPLSIRSTLDVLKELEKEGHESLCEIITEKMNPYTLGEFLRTLDIAKDYQKKLLSSRMFAKIENGNEKASQIAEKMASGYIHHGYFIGIDEARNIGLNIIEPSKEEWDIIWKIEELFEEREELKYKEEEKLEGQRRKERRIAKGEKN